MSTMPTDPLLSGQWNVTSSRGGVRADLVWPDYTGDGTSIAFLDTGIAPGNPDLDPGFRLSLSWDYVGGDNDPRVGYGNGHAEAVAGVAVGAANGTGIVGIAHGAEWGVVRYGTTAHIATGIREAALKNGVDVINNSWGWTTPWADMERSSDIRAILDSMAVASTQGREGLGSVLVFAAGNNGAKGDQTGSHAVLQSIHAVTVGGIDASGKVLAMSTPGAAVLVSAGAASFQTTSYQGTAMSGAGTSYAAPAVSGVTSLALEANSGLGARDIHEILAISASLSYDPSSLRHGATTNQATGWNGGGMVFSNDVGFGVADARAAVRLAETRFAVGSKADTFGNATTLVSTSGTLSVADGGTGQSSLTMSQNASIQKVQVTVTFGTLPKDSAFGFELVSASGTKSTLFSPILDLSGFGGVSYAPRDTVVTFESNAFWGEDAAGTWKLVVKDALTNGSGISISNVKLTVTGEAASASDRFYFTDDFALLATGDPARTYLVGHAGGQDTLDFSAFTAAVRLDLAAKSFLAGTTAIAVSASDSVVNAIGGDGADLIVGNASANVIWGGRGNDILNGGGGDDTLRGGQGDDILDGGDGAEDVALYSNDASFYAVTQQEDGSVTVRQIKDGHGPSDGFDTLRGIEFIRFGSRHEAPDAYQSELALGAPRAPLSVSVSDASMREGDAGTAPMSFVLTLSRPSTAPVTVRYATQNGTATAGSDYNAASGTVTFAIGETRKEVQVGVRGDLAWDGDEQFFLKLSSPTGAVLGRAQATGTIVDDDPLPPVVSVADLSIQEGAAGTRPIAGFVVSLSQASALPVTVSYATQPGSAAAGTDFVATRGTLTFAPGQTTKIVPVTIIGDASKEMNETFVLALSAPVGATLGRAAATATILNDDPDPVVAVVDVAKAEGNAAGTLIFTVTLSASSVDPVSLSWTTADGTARAGSDYVAGSGTLTFAPGETSKTVTVRTLGDGTVEANETFRLVLTSPTGATLGRGEAVATLLNDDVLPTLSVSDVRITEGAEGATTKANFVVTLSRAYAEAVTVSYATADGTATGAMQAGIGSGAPDYLAAAGTITFAAGETTKTLAVSVVGDGFIEADETFKLILTSPVGATLAKGTGTATIANDDVAPVLTVAPTRVLEAAGKASFQLVLSRSWYEGVTVTWATKDGTALAGSDYVAASGTVTFAPGETRKTVDIAILNDGLAELDETFSLVLGTTSIAKLPTIAPVATIQNDDTLPTVSISPVSVREAAGSATFSVKLSKAYDAQVGVSWATKAGTALAGSDFVAGSGRLEFAPGETIKTVTVAIVDDRLFELTETFTVALSSPSNAVLGSASGLVTIVDDDALPALSVSDVTLTEGAPGAGAKAVFEVTLSAPYGVPTTVNFATKALTASAGTDFVATSGKLTFAAGETRKTVAVDIVGDNLAEANETFQLVLSAPVNATLAKAAGTATILNDDTAPVVSVGDGGTVFEGAKGTTAPVTFAVTLSKPYDAPVTVSYSTKALTASAGSDFASVSGKVTFAAGETSKSVNVTVLGDNVAEADETFQLVLSAPVNATLGRASGNATIANDDTAPVVSVSDAKVVETSASGMASFVIGMSKAYDAAVTVSYATAFGTATSADLTAARGTVSFAAGETQKIVNVRVAADKLVEADETFQLLLSGATGAVIGRAFGIGTIFDDDGGHVPPSLHANSQHDVWATLFSLPTSSGHQEWSLLG